VHAKASLTPLGQPAPELPVCNVKRAQHHYRDTPGFEFGPVHRPSAVIFSPQAQQAIRARQPVLRLLRLNTGK
jgi:hypothetical protein